MYRFCFGSKYLYLDDIKLILVLEKNAFAPGMAPEPAVIFPFRHKFTGIFRHMPENAGKKPACRPAPDFFLRHSYRFLEILIEKRNRIFGHASPVNCSLTAVDGGVTHSILHFFSCLATMQHMSIA